VRNRTVRDALAGTPNLRRQFARDPTPGGTRRTAWPGIRLQDVPGCVCYELGVTPVGFHRQGNGWFFYHGGRQCGGPWGTTWGGPAHIFVTRGPKKEIHASGHCPGNFGTLGPFKGGRGGSIPRAGPGPGDILGREPWGWGTPVGAGGGITRAGKGKMVCFNLCH